MPRRLNPGGNRYADRTVVSRPRKPVPLWFPAAYATTCHRCLGEIRPGDHVRFDVDKEVVHARHQHAEETTPPPCSDCFMVHKGECL